MATFPNSAPAPAPARIAFVHFEQIGSVSLSRRVTRFCPPAAVSAQTLSACVRGSWWGPGEFLVPGPHGEGEATASGGQREPSQSSSDCVEGTAVGLGAGKAKPGLSGKCAPHFSGRLTGAPPSWDLWCSKGSPSLGGGLLGTHRTAAARGDRVGTGQIPQSSTTTDLVLGQTTWVISGGRPGDSLQAHCTGKRSLPPGLIRHAGQAAEGWQAPRVWPLCLGPPRAPAASCHLGLKLAAPS